jgi:hypothetical protein
MKKTNKKIKAWAIIDTQREVMRYCYADKKGSKPYKSGVVAIFFKKPTKILKADFPYKEYKQIIPVLITPIISKGRGKK